MQLSPQKWHQKMPKELKINKEYEKEVME